MSDSATAAASGGDSETVLAGVSGVGVCGGATVAGSAAAVIGGDLINGGSKVSHLLEHAFINESPCSFGMPAVCSYCSPTVTL
eukprot:scaffold33947_cov76-Attheya_sp.AAC.1